MLKGFWPCSVRYRFVTILDLWLVPPIWFPLVPPCISSIILKENVKCFFCFKMVPHYLEKLDMNHIKFFKAMGGH